MIQTPASSRIEFRFSEHVSLNIIQRFDRTFFSVRAKKATHLLLYPKLIEKKIKH